MSLDIYLTHRGTGAEVAWINWLRNPFGLANWLRDNTGVNIYNVVNDHAYDDSKNVDRAAFLAKAQEAVAAVDKLEAGYFWISLDWGWSHTTTRELIAKGLPHRIAYARGYIDRKGQYRCDVKAKVEINDYQRYLPAAEAQSFGRYDLDYYRRWTREFLTFAQHLQDPSLDYYCSN